MAAKKKSAGKPGADTAEGEQEKKYVGRPQLFRNEKQLKEQIAAYFHWIKGEKEKDIDSNGEVFETWKRFPEPATITGLCLFLGFESRQSLYDYIDRNDELSYIMKRGRTLVECEYEKNLSGTTPAGSIFALKNMGWKDKTEQEFTGPGGGPIDLVPLTINVIQPKKEDEDLG